MIRVRVSLPLFSSPIASFGSVSGEVDLDALPDEGDAFPWPKDWDTEGLPHFTDGDQSRIWGLSSWDLSDAEHLATMYGFVCASDSEARQYAEFFQQVGGFDFDEY